MSSPVRFEAIGPRGEACIILRHVVHQPNGTQAPAWTLASGERLRPDPEAPDEFQTLDGRRRFRLRQPAPHG